MTASKHCKALTGLKLEEVAQITGKSRVTLHNWFNSDIQAFTAICLGAAEIKRHEALANLIDE